MKTKILLFALLAQLLSLTASAYDLYKNGIYYNLNSEDMTAEVTYAHKEQDKYDKVTEWGLAWGEYYAKSGYNTFYSGSVTIPEKVNGYKVTSIGKYAFYLCTEVTSVTIPSSVKRIECYAFYDCEKIKSLTIPSSVEYIGYHAVLSSHVTSYTSTQEGLVYINNVLWKYTGTMPENANIVLREGTTCICSNAFRDQANMASIVIPESVKYISGPWTFSNCTNLKSITLPKKLTLLSEGATFGGCVSLESIEVPAYDENDGIYGSVFGGCDNLKSVSYAEGTTKISRYVGVSSPKLSYLYLPSTLTTIEGSWPSSNLTTVKAAMKQPVPITEGVFPTRANATLYVPYGSRTAYAEAGFWRGFKEIIEMAPEPEADTPVPDNAIYINKVESNAGQEVTLPFQMKNSAAIRGFQFDLYLPVGVTAVKNAKGRIQGALSSGRLPEDDEHTMTIQEQPDGAIRFLCNSLYDETFTGSDGEIATLQVKIADNLEDGDYPIVIKNMKLTETNISNFYETDYLKSTLSITSYMLGDVNSDTMIDILDYTGVANHIVGIAQDVFVEKAADVDNSGQIDVADYTGIANLIMTGNVYGTSNNVKAENGRRKAADYGDNYIIVQDTSMPITDARGAEVELSLCMKNSAPIRGFQFDMYLPEGFTVVKNAKGRISASLTPARLADDDEHTLTVQEQADGAIRFLCSSLYDETFTGTDGEIATVKVKIAENIADGNYRILLRNMKLTETNISNYYEADNVESVFIVASGNGIAELALQNVSIQAQGGSITVEGATDGTAISVYSSDGMLQGTAVADKGIATLSTSLQAGSIAFVKVGENAIKVLMK